MSTLFVKDPRASYYSCPTARGTSALGPLAHTEAATIVESIHERSSSLPPTVAQPRVRHVLSDHLRDRLERPAPCIYAERIAPPTFAYFCATGKVCVRRGRASNGARRVWKASFDIVWYMRGDARLSCYASKAGAP